MIWRDFILSDEFAQYRKELVYTIAKYIDAELFMVDAAELRGALKMAKVVLKTPARLCNSEAPETQEQLRKLLAEDFSNLTVKLVRESIS